MFDPPWYLVPEHGVKDGDHLAHAGSQGDLLVFAGGHQPLVGATNDGIVLNGGQHGHKQDRAHTGASTTDAALASHRAAVAVKRCNTDEGCDLFIGQRTEFRQVGQQGVDDLAADAGDGEQQIAFLAPLIDLLDQLGDEVVEFLDLGLQVTRMAPDIRHQGPGHDIQAPEHCADALCVVGLREIQGPLVDGDIQLVFANVDADVDGFFPFSGIVR